MVETHGYAARIYHLPSTTYHLMGKDTPGGVGDASVGAMGYSGIVGECSGIEIGCA